MRRRLRKAEDIIACGARPRGVTLRRATGGAPCRSFGSRALREVRPESAARVRWVFALGAGATLTPGLRRAGCGEDAPAVGGGASSADDATDNHFGAPAPRSSIVAGFLVARARGVANRLAASP